MIELREMRGPLIYSIAVTIVAVGAIGFGIGFVVSGALDDDSEVARATNAPQSTEYEPRLTATEAAAKAKAWVIDRARNEGASESVITSLQRLDCDGQDFNAGDRAWIVLCRYQESSYTLRVYDQSEEVESVR